MRGQKPLRADDHVSWLFSDLAVYRFADLSDSESASPHANQTEPPTLHHHSPANFDTSFDDEDYIPLQQFSGQPTMYSPDDARAAHAYGQSLSPGRAPALARATLCFNRDAFPAVGHNRPPVWPSPPRSRGPSLPIRSQGLPPTYDRFGPCRCPPEVRSQKRFRRFRCTSKCAPASHVAAARRGHGDSNSRCGCGAFCAGIAGRSGLTACRAKLDALARSGLRRSQRAGLAAE